MGERDLLFRAENISKSFGVTRALKNVTVEIRAGQILGLIGENGSGKSTMASIIACIQKADEGTLYMQDAPFAPGSSTGANRQGVCMILQEKGTFDSLSAAKNIYIGKEEMFSRALLLSNRAMDKAAQKALDGIGAGHIRASVPVGALSFEDAKLVELARAMCMEPKLLIVDETTTALSQKGRGILYGIMERMRDEGRSVLFISHDIEELMQVCDTLTILRDGDYVDTLEKDAFDAPTIRKLMVGRDVADHYYRNDMEPVKSSDVVLRMEHVQSKELKDVSYTLCRGEILGVGGLADSGMHNLGSISFGLEEPDLGGVVTADGRRVDSPTTATRARIAYISKNRDTESLMVASSIRDNICLASYKKLKKGPVVPPSKEKAFVNEWAGVLEIKMREQNQYVMELSGGNKQKVALAKWLGFGADIFIMDCPTRGIDIGVKSNIYQLMTELRAEGKSIILISEELPEVIGMSDRVMILRNGEVTGVFGREEQLTESRLIDYMI